MEKIFRVKGRDGYVKEFTDEKLALEFETRIKKEAEEEAEKIRVAEEKKNLLKKERVNRFNDLENRFQVLHNALADFNFDLNKYEDDFGVHLYYKKKENGELNLLEAKQSIDFAWDYFWDKLNKSSRYK